MDQADLGTFCCIGISQTGKTSTINQICCSNVGVVGTGDGNSVTKTSNFYCTKSPLLNSEIQLIDLPGFLDSDLSLSDEEIQNLIKMQVSESIGKNRTLKGFLIFESVQNNSITIMNCLEKLCHICGQDSRNSVLVLITKVDLASVYPGRIEGIIKLCNQSRIPYVCWSNELTNLSENQKAAQIASLKNSLIEIQPFQSQWIDSLRNRIVEISKELASRQRKPDYAVIVAKAEQLSKESPMIAETRIRSEIVDIEVEKVVQYTTSHGLFGVKSKVRNEVIKVTEQAVKTDSYTENVQTSYLAFMNAAEEFYAPKPAEYFEEEASQIVKQDIKSLLKKSFDH